MTATLSAIGPGWPAGLPAPITGPFAVKRRLTSKRPKRAVENDEYAAFVRRALAGLSRRVAAGDVEALAALLALANQLEDELRHAVTGLREQGYSWAEIGARAGMTRQAAHQRWRTDTTDRTDSPKEVT